MNLSLTSPSSFDTTLPLYHHIVSNNAILAFSNDIFVIKKNTSFFLANNRMSIAKLNGKSRKNNYTTIVVVWFDDNTWISESQKYCENVARWQAISSFSDTCNLPFMAGNSSINEITNAGAQRILFLIIRSFSIGVYVYCTTDLHDRTIIVLEMKKRSY